MMTVFIRYHSAETGYLANRARLGLAPFSRGTPRLMHTTFGKEHFMLNIKLQKALVPSRRGRARS